MPGTGTRSSSSRRSKEELQNVARQLRDSYGIEVMPVAADLEQPDAAQQIFETIKAEALQVDFLVNNAGHGFRSKFWEAPLATHLSIVRLNVEAVLRMTSLFLPPMLRRRRGRILNTASIAGFQPGPLVAVYHASKAFVLSWSEALSTELEGTGVTATALCPGPTDTDFFLKADMEDTKAFQKGHVMAPQKVAEIGYNALMAGERVVVTGIVNKAMVFSRHLMPESAQAKFMQKQYEKVPAKEQKRRRGEFERAASK